MFFVNFFTANIGAVTDQWSVVKFFTGGDFSTYFSFAYGLLVIWTIVVSLGGPLDKAMFYFYLFSAIFSFLTIGSLIGIVATLVHIGINPEEKECR